MYLRLLVPAAGIQLVITLSVSRPFPFMNELLAILRKECNLIRYDTRTETVCVRACVLVN